MNSGVTGKGRLWRTVATVTVVVVIAAGIITIWVTVGDEKSTASSRSNLTATAPAEPTPIPGKAAKKVRDRPSPTARPLTTEASPRPTTAHTSAPPVHVQEQPPAPVKQQCPTGIVTAHLTSVDFVTSPPRWKGETMLSVTVTARGVLTNDTTANIGVGESDIPNFLGLDDRGQSAVIELYGTYDWAPPPGEPSYGDFILHPGESVAYTAVANVFDTTVEEVRYWYSANDPGSILLYYPGLWNCSVPATRPDASWSIPNRYAG